MKNELFERDVVQFKQEFVQMLNDEAELPKEITDNYEVINLLSESKRAQVYLICSKKDKNKYVLKKYDEKDKHKDSVLKLLSHKKIPKFIDEYIVNGKVYFIREYFEGVTLAEYVDKNGMMPYKRVSEIALQILDILDYLHTRETPIIYRDIKAENIIIDEYKEIELIDFDISREFDETVSKDTVYLGTKQYSPPEQFGYAQTDIRTDIYALGVLMLFLMQRTTDIDKIDDIENNAIKKIVKKATSFAPKDRYKNVPAFKKAILKSTRASNAKISLKAVILIGILSIALGFMGGFLVGKNNNDETNDINVETNSEPIVNNEVLNVVGDEVTDIADIQQEVILEEIVYPFIENPEAEAVFKSELIEKAVRAQLGKSDDEKIIIKELDQIEYLNFWGNTFYDDSEMLSLQYGMHFDNLMIHVGEYDSGYDEEITAGSISNLDDLYMFRNIKSLDLVLQRIDDISQISHLPLEKLDISGNSIKDLSPLKECISIQNLVIDGNPIEDINSLSNLSYLTGFSASQTLVSDLTPLSNSYKLEFIYINNARIKDVSPLSNLSIVNLFLENNDIEDFSALPDGIETLSIEGNP